MADTFPEITVELKAYKSHPRNYNRHPASQIERLRASLRKFGQPRNIVVWRKYFVAGHGVAQAAMAEGWATLRANEIPADWPEARVMAFLAADNELSRLSDPDQAALAALIDEARQFDGELLTAIGYDDKEFAELLKAVGNATTTTPSDAPPQVDRADELRKLWQVEPGQLWRIGEHRLICGDCTDAATVGRVMGGEKAVLMVTDPPYGVEYDPDWRNDAAEKGLISYGATNTGKVMNDDRVDWTEAYRLSDAQVVYLWHAGRHAKEIQSNLEEAGYKIISQIIWAKPTFAISRGDYHWQHEPCWYAVKNGKTHNWQGSRSESTLWEINRGGADKTGHGTEKPIECMARPIRNNTQPGAIVYEPFAGSGTTGIACEQLGRRCRMIEIDPKYCAVILERFKQIGITPELIK